MRGKEILILGREREIDNGKREGAREREIDNGKREPERGERAREIAIGERD